ncbi:MAG: hypothetical protein ABDH91_08630 [Bacteroidia bacterium]
MWDRLAQVLQRRFGKVPTLEELLFLVGLNELGYWPAGEDKQVKYDLIHLGFLTLLERAGYVRRQNTDAEGWPTWVWVQDPPHWDPLDEAAFLREALCAYFAQLWEF